MEDIQKEIMSMKNNLVNSMASPPTGSKKYYHLALKQYHT